jgi:agarase
VNEVLSEAAEFRDNPLLLGYFVDNESGWGHLDLLNRLPKDAYLRREWGKYLQSVYGDVGHFAAATGKDFASWEAVYNASDEKGLPQRDVQILEEMYARKYFEVITKTLKKYDPNHLYLGCRFTRALKPEHLLKVAGEYCDVVTVNVYAYEPEREQMNAWYRLTGRPILIGEHHVALDSDRQLPLRWQVFSSAERYEYYTNYVRTWAEMPYSLGCHWYQWADQNLTGRASNGENQIVGFVDITDQPYDNLVQAVRDVSEKVYTWHAGTSKD